MRASEDPQRARGQARHVLPGIARDHGRETSPNHTAMITGACGDTSGIPANDFNIYGNGAVSVDGCPLVTTSSGPTKAGLAPGCVKAQTVFQSTAAKAVRNRITTAGIFRQTRQLATLFSAKRSTKKYAADYLWTPCTSTKTSLLPQSAAERLRLCRRQVHHGCGADPLSARASEG